MKSVFLSMILGFVSSTSLACPIINGNYKCNFNGKEEVVTYTTRIENGVHLYEMDTTSLKGEVPADGNWRRYGSNPDIDLALVCNGDNLFLRSRATNVSGDLANFACAGSGVDHIDGQSDWIVEATQIDQQNKGQIHCGNGNILNISGDYACVKQ